MNFLILGALLWGPTLWAFPQNLSEWDIFHKVAHKWQINPNHKVYKLNTPLFTDYAHKVRTVFIPKNSKIKLKGDHYIFPEGTVLSKTFSYPDASGVLGPWSGKHRLVETRILFKHNKGWTALPYVWENGEGILKIQGKSIPMNYNGEHFSYEVPNINQCKGCHIQYIGFDKQVLPLGPRYAPNLTDETLKKFVKENLVNEIPNWSMVTWDDPTQDQTNRAKAYLHTNCAHCHNADGPASTSGLYLQYKQKSKKRRGICKGPVAAGRGSGGRPYAISPGRPDESIIIFRMNSKDPDISMPEIGRSLVHKEGVKLIEEYIQAMSESCVSLGSGLLRYH